MSALFTFKKVCTLSRYVRCLLYFFLQLVQQQDTEDEAEASQEEDKGKDDEVT